MAAARRRHTTSALAVSLALLAGACGGSGELTLTEYVDRINEISVDAGTRADALVEAAGRLSDPTPLDVADGLRRATEIRLEIKEATDDLTPPPQIADLHDRIFDWHDDFIEAEEALARRVAETDDTVNGWTELSDSDEVAAYRAAIATGKTICETFQAELDATAARGVFADTPWLPGEMKESVDALLGCEWFPEHPEDVYRYPPVTGGAGA